MRPPAPAPPRAGSSDAAAGAPEAAAEAAPAPAAAAPKPRAVIDYALARRSVLADLFAGRVSTLEVCDAHPYLQRAAKYHGEPTQTPCPVCRREPLTHVRYAFGDELRVRSGHARSPAELAEMALQYGEFGVYVVEVCRGCGWNHLSTSYTLGTARPRPQRKARVPRAAARGRAQE